MVPQYCFRSGGVTMAWAVRRRIHAEFPALLAARKLGRTVSASLAALMLTALFVLPLAGQTAPSHKAPPAHNAGRSQGLASPDGAGLPPPSGQLIYENGPINGNVDTWEINFGFVVSDTFTVVNNGTTVTELSFGAWLTPGDTLTSVEVSITSGENGGTSYLRSDGELHADRVHY